MEEAELFKLQELLVPPTQDEKADKPPEPPPIFEGHDMKEEPPDIFYGSPFRKRSDSRNITPVEREIVVSKTSNCMKFFCVVMAIVVMAIAGGSGYFLYRLVSLQYRVLVLLFSPGKTTTES